MMDSIGIMALFLAVGLGFLGVTLGPIGQALARRIGGKAALPEDIDARLRALEEHGPVTGEQDLIAQRLLELEERLDFAERMLASGADSPPSTTGET